jgi:hypothetical protein
MSSRLSIVEQRAARRYAVRLPVRFIWREAGGGLGRGLGHSHDISLKGAFIHADSIPPLGSEVACEIQMASPYHPGRETQLLSQAVVLRRDHRGFAISTAHQFRMGRKWRMSDEVRDFMRTPTVVDGIGNPGLKM